MYYEERKKFGKTFIRTNPTERWRLKRSKI